MPIADPEWRYGGLRSVVRLTGEDHEAADVDSGGRDARSAAIGATISQPQAETGGGARARDIFDLAAPQ